MKMATQSSMPAFPSRRL